MNISVEDNLNLVHYVLSKMNVSTCQYDDLFQEGVIGLMKAIKTFNIEKQNKFSTYAYICIKNEILHFLKKNTLSQIYLDDEIYDGITFSNYISNDEPSVLFNLIQEEEHDKIKKVIQTRLTELEKQVLFMSYGINCLKMKQKEIENKLNLKQYQISRIKKKALNTIKFFIMSE